MKFHWMAALLLAGCATTGPDDEVGQDDQDLLSSAGAWYTLDAITGHTGPATLSVANGRLIKCPDGTKSSTCHATSVTVPATCGFECQDGLFGLQGATLLKGHFSGSSFVVEVGLDTWRAGLGSYSIYHLTGAATCSMDPCPSTLSSQKVNFATAPTTVNALDFSHADDTNYVLDPTLGDAASLSANGLYVTGHVVNHQFRVDRTWRLETPLPACDTQSTAGAHANGGNDLTNFRTVAVAERAVGPDPEDSHVHWLVRTAENPTTSTFTWGINDLWAEIFTVDKSTCAVTTIAEH